MSEAKQGGQNYDDMTDEQLEELLDSGQGVVHPEDTEPEPPSEPDPPREGEAKTEDDPPTEPVDEPASGETSTESDPPEEPESVPDERELELQELRLQVQRNELDREKHKFDRDREAGTAGALRQEVESLKSMISSGRFGDGEQGDDDDEQSGRQSAFRDPRVDELLSDSKRGRVEEAYRQFEGQLRSEIVSDLGSTASSDAIDAELKSRIDAMTPMVQEEVGRYKNDNLNARAAAKVMRMALDSANIEYKINRQRELRKEALSRKAEQVSARKREKLDGTDSASSPAAPLNKSPKKEMTADEADAALRKEFGEDPRR